MRTIINKHCNELRMLTVRNYVENEVNFNMTVWIGEVPGDGPTCETAMCIGGTASFLMSLENKKQPTFSEYQVSDWLGLDRAMGMRLFYCRDDNTPVHEVITNEHWYRLYNVTREQALQAIDNVIADGAPHWDVICADHDRLYARNNA